MKKQLAIFFILISIVLISCKKKETKLKPVKAIIAQFTGIVLTSEDIKLPIDKWKPVKTKEIVGKGTFIRTRLNSACQIMLNNGSAIKLDSNTILYIDQMLASNKGITHSRFKLNSGSILAKPARLLASSSFTITTPTAVAGVRGTEFIVDHSQGNTNIAVSQGRVVVRRNIVFDAQTRDNRQARNVFNKATRETVLTPGQAAQLNRQQNKKIEQAIKKVVQGQNINRDEVFQLAKIKKRVANDNEVRRFKEFKNIKRLPSEERKKYGMLIVFGGDGTKIYINGALEGQDMAAKILKEGTYNVKIMKGNTVLKETSVNIKGKTRTVVKVGEPNYTAPETFQERQRKRDAENSIRVFEDQQRRNVDNVFGELNRRSRVFRDDETTRQQRRAVNNPDSTRYGTSRDVFERLNKRTQQNDESGGNLNQRERLRRRAQRGLEGKVRRNRRRRDNDGAGSDFQEGNDNDVFR